MTSFRKKVSGMQGKANCFSLLLGLVHYLEEP